MIHLFINALSASAGGGLTYIRNIVPLLAARDDVRATLLVPEPLRSEIAATRQIDVLQDIYPPGAARRFGYEQVEVSKLIRRARAEVLLSTGNFAVFRSPVPQILLSRNALYLSADFMRDLRERGDYRLWIDTKIKGAFARWSVQVADCTIAPSTVFAEGLRRWTGKDVRAIHHGFNHEAFLSESIPLSLQVRDPIQATKGSVRILFVSHYNYYRNFETLIRALAILKRNLQPRPVRLILTCRLSSNANPGSYKPDSAANLVRQLKLREEVVELDAVPYGALHNLYRECDVYVTPAYAETFAHPLVEAMASGLPIIASDLAVHHEICGEAAHYFPRFSPEALAECILRVCASSEERAAMRALGLMRSQGFTWDKHVKAVLAVANELNSTAKGTRRA